MNLEIPIGFIFITGKVMRITAHIAFILIVLLSGCRQPDNRMIQIDHTPDIFPDYRQVTIPYNIAPLNFRVNEDGKKVFVSLNHQNKSSEFEFSGRKVMFPEKKWAALLKDCRNDSIEVSVRIVQNGSLKQFMPFKIFVSGEPVDGYLVYRLLMPGFQNWNQMGIYQRSLSSFKCETIIDSRILPGTCMNCHSFAMNDPQNMVLHLRESYGGTILVRGDKVEKLNTKAGRMFGNAAFPYWHPSKRYIVFSVNKVNQVFHAIGPARASAIDMKSDIFVYDIENNEMLTSPLLSAEENFESFPCFSPDGLKLYYCSARAVKLPEKYDKIRYSLCSVSFDPATGKFGDKADTLISGPSINKSISIPRVSPDNRFLMFNMTDYGCFPSYNPEADLYLMNIESGHYEALDNVNSNNTESYHSWSSNGRWFVFSSRRGDGLYSWPYLAYIDKSGKTGKPFLLPQEDPGFYNSFLFSFNVPELVRSRVPVNPYSIERAAKRSPAVQVMTGSGH
jgi:hypothetical protein